MSHVLMEDVFQEGRRVTHRLSMDRWEDALDFLSSKREQHWTFDSGYELIKCFQSYMSGSGHGHDHEYALRCIKTGLKVLQGHRKHSWSLTDLLTSYNFDQVMDEDALLELTHAEFCMIVAGVYLENKRSFGHFIQASNYIRKGYSSYLMCRRILNEKTNWSSSVCKENFQAGVLIFFGVLEMGFAIVPPLFSTILHFIGYSGDRLLAYDMLIRAFRLKGTFRRIFAAAILVGYLAAASYVLDHGNPDKTVLREVLTFIRDEYPGMVYTNILDMVESVTLYGDINGALDIVNRSNLTFSTKMASFIYPNCAKLCLLVLQERWREAEMVSRVYEEQVWSPATGTFLRAMLLQKVMEESDDQMEKLSIKGRVSELLRLVQERKRRVLGVLYHEEFQLMYSKRFQDRPEDMVLPLYELMSTLRTFATFNLSREAIEGILKQVDRRWRQNEGHSSGKEYYDAKSILLYIRGHCFRHIGRHHEALQSFHDIIAYDKRLRYAKHIPPLAACDIGRIYDEKGKVTTAKKWVKTSLSYSGYCHQILIQYRAKMALQGIRKLNDDNITTGGKVST